MPTATSFTAIGKGNGFPFCIVHATQSAINAIDGNTYASGGGVRSQGKFRIKELSFANLFPYIWNLYSVTFPTVTHGGVDHTFASAGIYKMGDVSDGYADLSSLTPKERVCFNPDLTLSPLTNPGDVAEAQATSNQTTFGRFNVHGICFATDTSKYYLVYMSGLYADDQTTLEVEIPFANLTFNYYTYS